jgi:hypothetical protein
MSPSTATRLKPKCVPIGQLFKLRANRRGFKLLLRFAKADHPDEVLVEGTDDQRRCRRSGVWVSEDRYETLECTLIPYVDGVAGEPISFDADGNMIDIDPPPPPPGDDVLTPNPTVRVSGFSVVADGANAAMSWTSTSEPGMEFYLIRRKAQGETAFIDLFALDPQGPSDYETFDSPGSGQFTYLLCAQLQDGTVENLAVKTITL